MTTLNPNERDHALDATRAFALLLGVVFHAAWSFVPRAYSAPTIDRSANEAFAWFFYVAHTFRMQLFFLIAGFFARLLFERSGYKGFAIHRLKRIAMPLIVGWFILVPTTIAAWMWGYNHDGANLTTVPMGSLFSSMFTDGKLFVMRPDGGMFTFAHLWFLYYLLWAYVVVLLTRLLLVGIVPTSFRLRERADGVTAHIMNSGWSLLWLSAITAVLLCRMQGWFGVATASTSLVPNPLVLALYSGFLALGWLLHRQAWLLRTSGKRWRWQVAVALLILIPLYFVFVPYSDEVAGGSEYPLLSPQQVQDWPQMISILQSGASADESTDLGQLWNQILPESTRDAILRLDEGATISQVFGVCRSLNKLIIQPTLWQDDGHATTSPLATSGPFASMERTPVRNRRRLNAIMQGALSGDPRDRPHDTAIKLAYSFGYSIAMWLLVLGTLGAFQDKFPAHSPKWRYIADSSYWVYLVHIPVVPAIQVWISPWPLPSPIKFTFLLALTSLILFGTYHLFVRSTFIGRWLNGRKYPFRIGFSSN